MKLKTMITMAVVAFALTTVVKAADEPKNSAPTQTARMSDAEMKALLIGTWTVNDNTTEVFRSDGIWSGTEPRFPNEVGNRKANRRWDIKDGQLIEIRPHPEGERPYHILFLTEYECLLHWGHHGGGYSLWTRGVRPDY
jgi:hypothetical protein